MAEKKPLVLLIEDELSIHRFIKSTLESQGYQFLGVTTGQEGLSQAQHNKPDTILLDLGLPDMDGLEVIKQLRNWTLTPIIIISVRDQELDKVRALNLGADDYLSKPFGIDELMARIRVALRHASFIDVAETPVFESGPLKIDLIKRRVYLQANEVALSPTQFAILAILVRKADKIVTHQQLLSEVWGEKHMKDIDYLRIYIHQLRHKIEVNPARPQFLQTEPGIGYRFVSQRG